MSLSKCDKTYGNTAVLFGSTGLVQQLKVARHVFSLNWFPYYTDYTYLHCDFYLVDATG